MPKYLSNFLGYPTVLTSDPSITVIIFIFNVIFRCPPDLSRQSKLSFQVLTKDSVTVNVDAVVYYRVCNATIAISNIANFDVSTQLLAATTLRTVLGTKNLSEILSEREQISHTMQVGSMCTILRSFPSSRNQNCVY